VTSPKPTRARHTQARDLTHTPVTPRRPANFDTLNALGMGDALALAADYDLCANELFGVAR
jgi:uncharacterized protein (DUF2249 family)